MRNLDTSSIEARYFDDGNLQRRQGRAQAAVESYNKAIELKRDFFQAFHNRGEAFTELEQHESAISDYTQAIEIIQELGDQGESALSFANRGNARCYLKQFRAAIADFDAALRLNPNHAGALMGRANAYYEMGEHTKAIPDYEAALRLRPAEPMLRFSLGRAFEAVGRKREAREAYSRFINEASSRFSEKVHEAKKLLCELDAQEENAEKPHEIHSKLDLGSPNIDHSRQSNTVLIMVIVCVVLLAIGMLVYVFL